MGETSLPGIFTSDLSLVANHAHTPGHRTTLRAPHISRTAHHLYTTRNMPSFIQTSIVLGASILAMTHAYDGDGTFYGSGGAGKQGACMLNPGFNGVGVTVAMNAAQYGNGASCGKCIRATGSGSGLGMTPIMGPIYATVDNECPECKFGDVDFGLGGDGRWRINWDFVDCGAARAAGSNLPARNGKRTLRGLLESEEGKNYLAPGYMVTADGIKLISDVVAEQQVATATIENGQN